MMAFLGAGIRVAMRAGVLVGVLGTTLVFTSACHRNATSSAELASRVTVTACPPGIAPSNPSDAPPNATLTVALRVEPAAASGTEALVRLTGETTRNTVRIDPTMPSVFTLRPDSYIVRVALAGYAAVEGRASLTAGCEATMSMRLVRSKP